jgi:hypothetical protein
MNLQVIEQWLSKNIDADFLAEKLDEILFKVNCIMLESDTYPSKENADILYHIMLLRDIFLKTAADNGSPVVLSESYRFQLLSEEGSGY